jgi:LysR family nitrogen assimilation transcriptional regulator
MEVTADGRCLPGAESMIDIRKLRYFATVAEFSSFTHAAKFLGVAQPALSRQVQQLEQEFGVELFSRRGRQVTLTDAGMAVLRHAHTIDRDFERLIDDMCVRKGTPTGRVVVGITPTLAEILVPDIARSVEEGFPRLSLKITEAVTPVLVDWVQSNRVDLAILSLAVMDAKEGYPALSLELLATEDMILVEKGGKRRTAKACTVARLMKKRLVVSDMLEMVVRQKLGLPDLDLDIFMQIDAVHAIKRMVLNGQAASILPVSVMSDEIRRGLVQGSAITRHGVQRQIVLAHPRHRQMTRAGEALSGILRSVIEGHVRAGIFSLKRMSDRGSARG